MEELRQVFIRNLKYYRKLHGIRQLDLALEIGKSTNYINSIENGKYFPSPETIEKIAETLSIEPMRLFDRSSPDNISKSTSLDLSKMKSQLQEIIARDIEQVFRGDV